MLSLPFSSFSSTWNRHTLLANPGVVVVQVYACTCARCETEMDYFRRPQTSPLVDYVTCHWAVLNAWEVEPCERQLISSSNFRLRTVFLSASSTSNVSTVGASCYLRRPLHGGIFLFDGKENKGKRTLVFESTATERLRCSLGELLYAEALRYHANIIAYLMLFLCCRNLEIETKLDKVKTGRNVIKQLGKRCGSEKCRDEKLHERWYRILFYLFFLLLKGLHIRFRLNGRFLLQLVPWRIFRYVEDAWKKRENRRIRTLMPSVAAGYRQGGRPIAREVGGKFPPDWVPDAGATR